MNIEKSLQHFQSSNTLEKGLDIAVSKSKEQIYMLACKWKLLLHNKKTNPIFFSFPRLHLSALKVAYHYKIICNDAWGPDYTKILMEVFNTEIVHTLIL